MAYHDMTLIIAVESENEGCSTLALVAYHILPTCLRLGENQLIDIEGLLGVVTHVI